MTDRQIMVIARKLLFEKDYFEGFRVADKVNYESRIIGNFQWMPKDLAEQNSLFKQPVAYSLVVSKNLRQVFAYRRAVQDSKYQEKRLQGKWSWGIGGHIEKFDFGNPIYSSMLRELQEEVAGINIQGIKAKVLGYINNDANSVGQVHFGILYLIETNSAIIKPKDAEIEQGSLRTISELEEILKNPDFAVEEWSKIAFEPLKSFLS